MEKEKYLRALNMHQKGNNIFVLNINKEVTTRHNINTTDMYQNKYNISIQFFNSSISKLS